MSSIRPLTVAAVTSPFTRLGVAGGLSGAIVDSLNLPTHSDPTRGTATPCGRSISNGTVVVSVSKTF